MKTTMLGVRQGDQESTHHYMDHFATKVQRVDCSEEAVMMTLSNGLRPTHFSNDLVRDSVLTFAEAMEQLYSETNVEDYHEAKYKQMRQRQKGQNEETSKLQFKAQKTKVKLQRNVPERNQKKGNRRDAPQSLSLLLTKYKYFWHWKQGVGCFTVVGDELYRRAIEDR